MLDDLKGQHCGHLHFQFAHPEALRRLDRLDGEIATAACEMDVWRARASTALPRCDRSRPRRLAGSTATYGCWIGVSTWDWAVTRRASQRPWRWAMSMVGRGRPAASRPGPAGVGFAVVAGGHPVDPRRPGTGGETGWAATGARDWRPWPAVVTAVGRRPR